MTAQTIKILLAGGGTLGSVNPLVAVYEEAEKQGKTWKWFWVGTKSGPERALVQLFGIKYAALPTAKFRRYWSLANFLLPFVLLAAFIKSLVLMLKIRPQVVITAGSFVGVPTVWAAWVWSIVSPPLRPVRRSLGGGGGGARGGGRGRESVIVVHQQDIRPGLANKLCAPFADKITVTFEKSLSDYPAGKAEWLGNPVRAWIGQGSIEHARRLWSLDEKYPTLLIMGGSSGAQALNKWVWRNLPQLTEFANIIHLTGVGKSNKAVPSLFHLRQGYGGQVKGEGGPKALRSHPQPEAKGGEGGVRVGGTRYHQLEFLDKDLAHALAVADLVVSRAGIATLSELSYLGKATILIPLAGTHQEENAAYFANRAAALVFKQNELDENTVDKIKSLLADRASCASLADNIKKIMKSGAREKLMKIVSSVIASPDVHRDEAIPTLNAIDSGVASSAPHPLTGGAGLPRNDTHHIHLIGIGGINVSAIAKLLLSESKIVSGADLVASGITAELAEKGARVVIGHAKENIAPATELVIYSDAVPADNPERQAADERGIRQISNFQFWGEYSRDKKVIAVSGTNGKSTTTAMLGLILEAAGFDPTVVVGTRVLQWGSNIRIGKSEWLVIEADEYRAHMLEFQPHIAVITNITPDHLDFYQDLDDIAAHFQKWIETIPPDGGLVLNQDDAASRKLRLGNVKIVIPTDPASCGGVEESLIQGSTKHKGSLHSPPFANATGGSVGMTIVNNLRLQVPGQFNIVNALAAAGAAQLVGVGDDIIVSALNNFTGTWRRFEKVGKYNGALVISDYAHHPDGIKVTLQAARDKYPNRRLVVLYQPHQHNRTRKLFDQFVQSFDLADELILAEIYDVPGREQNQDQAVSSQDLAEAIRKIPSPLKGEGRVRVGARHLSSDHVWYVPNLQSAEETVKNTIKPNDVLIVMGAGDVDKVARNLCQP